MLFSRLSGLFDARARSCTLRGEYSSVSRAQVLLVSLIPVAGACALDIRWRNILIDPRGKVRLASALTLYDPANE